MIGLTLEEAEHKLKEQGITHINIIKNYERELEGSVLLVSSCKIEGGIATITLGSFKLDL